MHRARIAQESRGEARTKLILAANSIALPSARADFAASAQVLFPQRTSHYRAQRVIIGLEVCGVLALWPAIAQADAPESEELFFVRIASRAIAGVATYRPNVLPGT